MPKCSHEDERNRHLSKELVPSAQRVLSASPCPPRSAPNKAPGTRGVLSRVPEALRPVCVVISGSSGRGTGCEVCGRTRAPASSALAGKTLEQEPEPPQCRPPPQRLSSGQNAGCPPHQRPPCNVATAPPLALESSEVT